MKNTIQKFLILSLIFCASGIEVAAQTCTPAPAGLISWWRAEDNALDSKGGNHGTLQNGAGFDIGRVGRGFLFDGIDDQVVIGNVSSLDVQTGDFTIEAWANIAQSKFNFIASKDACGDPNIYSLHINQSDAPEFRVVNSAGNSFIVSASAVSLNEWHHIVGVKEGTNIKIYVDGVLQNTLAISGSFGANNKDFAIGNRINSAPAACGVNNFSGRIDEVSVYNRALSAEEIAAINAAGSAGKCLAATAASVSIGGRVTTARGRGIARARVLLTDLSGETRTALTNSFGYFRFEAVAAGENYILEARHKRYTFAPQVIFATEDLSEVNFTTSP